jgi:hypothetical protein
MPLRIAGLFNHADELRGKGYHRDHTGSDLKELSGGDRMVVR